MVVEAFLGLLIVGPSVAGVRCRIGVFILTEEFGRDGIQRRSVESFGSFDDKVRIDEEDFPRLSLWVTSLSDVGSKSANTHLIRLVDGDDIALANNEPFGLMTLLDRERMEPSLLLARDACAVVSARTR